MGVTTTDNKLYLISSTAVPKQVFPSKLILQAKGPT